MPAANQHRIFDRFVLAVVILLLAAPVTYLELAQPSLQQIQHAASQIFKALPAAGNTTAPAQATTASAPAANNAGGLPATANTTQATPQTATTISYVHLRSGKSVDSAILMEIPAGITVQLRNDANPTWQGVVYQGKDGYIYRAYLQYQ